MTADDVYVAVNSILDNTDNWFPVMQADNPALANEIFSKVINYAQLQVVRKSILLSDFNTLRTLQWTIREYEVIPIEPSDIQLATPFDADPNPEMFSMQGMILKFVKGQTSKYMYPLYIPPALFYSIKQNVSSGYSYFNDIAYTVLSRTTTTPPLERIYHILDVVLFGIPQDTSIYADITYIKKPVDFVFNGLEDPTNVGLELPEEYHYDVVLNSLMIFDAMDAEEIGRLQLSDVKVGLKGLQNA